jgi:uncharacterized protein YbcC (UPF0753/DUF2309 family)
MEIMVLKSYQMLKLADFLLLSSWLIKESLMNGKTSRSLNKFKEERNKKKKKEDLKNCLIKRLQDYL